MIYSLIVELFHSDSTWLIYPIYVTIRQYLRNTGVIDILHLLVICYDGFITFKVLTSIHYLQGNLEKYRSTKRDKVGCMKN